MNIFMAEAIEEARRGIDLKEGGPFGAVVVRGGEIIARGHNRVVVSKDPTAHAEIVAIRNASVFLNSFDLSDCILYTTCEPCPMCYGAIHWARIPQVFYGATRQDAAKIGFDDNLLYEFLSGRITDTDLSLNQVSRDDCLVVFYEYEKDEERVPY